MKISENPPVHLTYCLNIHPGERWEENLAAIREKAVRVRDRVCPGKAFGLGLRLSRRAADELATGDSLAEFRRYLDDQGLYVFTINGFPYGQFHGAAVKQNVYAPDWRTEERLAYTRTLCDVLAGLLPEGVPGSISTVPGSYKAWITADDDVRRIVENLAAAAMHLAGLAERTGRRIQLALEPEPDCLIETTDEAIAFFAGPLRTFGRAYLLERRGLVECQADRVLHDHLGVCFDTAHAAVQFERLDVSADRLMLADVPMAKVQLSSALEVRASARSLAALAAFRDRVYLHQVRVRLGDGRVLRFADLDEALGSAEAAGEGALWRVHFHVPLFWAGDGVLGSTGELLEGAFADYLRSKVCPNVEIETYTFSVMPDSVRPADVVDCVAGEYRWVLERILCGG